MDLPHDPNRFEPNSALALFLIVTLNAFSWTVIFPLLQYYVVTFPRNL